jgi:hypothetical protein
LFCSLWRKKTRYRNVDQSLTGTTSISSVVTAFRMSTREERSEMARNEKLFYFTIRLKGKNLGVL